LAKQRHKPSFISSILSVSFVLFLLGVLSILIFQAKKLSDHFKENIEISLFLKDNAPEAEIKQLELALAAEDYAREVEYISKGKAAEDFADQFEADVLDDNPLPASINLFLKSKYANPPLLEQKTIVNEIIYQEALLELVNNNISKIGTALGIATIIFLLIAFTLIDSAIRLSMYSKRFLIKSMQLVGATNNFIISPFIQRGILNGLLSSVIAILMLLGLYFYLTKTVQGLFTDEDFMFFSAVLVGMIIIGILVSLVSTTFSVKKYLHSKIEDLY